MYWKLLSPANRRHQLLLILLAGFSGVVELVSVGLVIPFVALAADALPFGAAQKLTIGLVGFLSGLGVPERYHVLSLGLLFFLGVTVANFYIACFQCYLSWFVAEQRCETTVRAAQSLCWQPLEWLELRNSSDFSKIVMFDSDRIGVIVLALTQTATVVARFLAVAACLLVANPRLALGMSLPLALGYWVVFKFVQRPLAGAAAGANLAAEKMSRQSLEMVGVGREMRAAGVQYRFLDTFVQVAESSKTPMILRNLPGYVTRAGLEVVTVLVVVILLFYFHLKDGNLANGLPLMSACAVAGVRLLPSVQQTLYLLFEIRFCAPSLAATYQMLGEEVEEPTGRDLPALAFRDSIVLKDVTYAYPGCQPTLRNVSLVIPKNSRVAFVGSTGAGKSTLVDLLLGLRFPREGHILVDGCEVTQDNVSAWNKNLGYVAQSIYLLDRSIAENIGFGYSRSEIDQEQLEKAARAANIHDFVMSLPEGYETIVGERGVRLSGGQCQRIGIARALFHEPEVVVFDEATSSLDTVTENTVLEALDTLKHGKTLLVIAHRLNTIWDFEHIVVLDQGEILAQGTSAELMQGCPKFAELARKSTSNA